MTFNEACLAIINSKKANGYAVAYAKAGVGMTGEHRRVQALYILNNLTHWRGENSKEVRATLKEYSKS